MLRLLSSSLRLLYICIIHLPPHLQSLALPRVSEEGITTSKLCRYVCDQSDLVSHLSQRYLTHERHTCALLIGGFKGSNRHNQSFGKQAGCSQVEGAIVLQMWTYDHVVFRVYL